MFEQHNYDLAGTVKADIVDLLENGMKYVNRLLNFYYTCVKTQWI